MKNKRREAAFVFHAVQAVMLEHGNEQAGREARACESSMYSIIRKSNPGGLLFFFNKYCPKTVDLCPTTDYNKNMQREHGGIVL